MVRLRRAPWTSAILQDICCTVTKPRFTQASLSFHVPCYCTLTPLFWISTHKKPVFCSPRIVSFWIVFTFTKTLPRNAVLCADFHFLLKPRPRRKTTKKCCILQRHASCTGFTIVVRLARPSVFQKTRDRQATSKYCMEYVFVFTRTLSWVTWYSSLW